MNWCYIIFSLSNFVILAISGVVITILAIRNKNTKERYARINQELRKHKEQHALQNQTLRDALHTLESHQEVIDERNKKLIEMNRLKTKLFSVISHDLRSPLATVMSMLELIKQGRMSLEEVKLFSEKAGIRVRSTYEMLTNILYWTRNQMQGLKSNPEDTNLEKLIIENLRVYQPIAQAKGILLQKEVWEPVYAFADPDVINLVIRNLLSNAIKFTPKGGVVELGVVEGEESVSVYVKDTGVGMNEQTIKQLFSSRISSTQGTQQEKGTGLGLSLCKEFVEYNQGRLTVESAPGEGSIFRFSLPLQHFEDIKEAS